MDYEQLWNNISIYLEVLNIFDNIDFLEFEMQFIIQDDEILWDLELLN